MESKQIEKLIDECTSLYIKADGKAQLIATEAQKYIDWDDNITCEYINGDGLVLCHEGDEFIPSVVPVSNFFDLALKNGKVSEEEFALMNI